MQVDRSRQPAHARGAVVMVGMLARRLMVAALLCLAGVYLLELFDPTPPPLLVQASFVRADLQICAPVRPHVSRPLGPVHRPSFYPHNSELS